MMVIIRNLLCILGIEIIILIENGSLIEFLGRGYLLIEIARIVFFLFYEYSFLYVDKGTL